MIIEESDPITPSSLHFPKDDTFFAELITTESSYIVEKSDNQNGFITLVEMEKNI